MNNEEIKNFVLQYFDGELGKRKQPKLFMLLAQNEEARNYLEQLSIIRKNIEESTEKFPAVLDERILKSLRKTENQSFFSKLSNPVPAIAFAVSVIMLIISLFLFMEVNSYKTRMEIISEQVNAQKQTIDLILYNSLPPAEVRAKSIEEIIIKSN